MDNQSPSPSPSSPDELAELKSQLADLSRRVSALERVSSSVRIASPAVASDSRLGLTAVNRIGAVTLALGILFFFKYAADNNWIGPGARICLGLCAGLAFLGFGERLYRKSQAALGLGISACGLAIVYITVYAACAFYKILLAGASFGLMVVVCLAAVALSLRYRNQALTCLGVLGALVTLAIMHGQTYVGLVFPYLLIVQIAAVVLAVSQSWSILVPFAAVLTMLFSSIIQPDTLPFTGLCLCVAAAHWLARTRVRSPASLATSLYLVGHAALLIAAWRVIDSQVPDISGALTAASVLLALYGMALLAAGVARKSPVDRAAGFALLGLVVAKLYLYDIWRLNYGFRITAFVVLGILLLGASFIYSRYKTRV